MSELTYVYIFMLKFAQCANWFRRGLSVPYCCVPTAVCHTAGCRTAVHRTSVCSTGVCRNILIATIAIWRLTVVRIMKAWTRCSARTISSGALGGWHIESKTILTIYVRTVKLYLKFIFLRFFILRAILGCFCQCVNEFYTYTLLLH